MDKILMAAFEKLQKREHRVRVLRDRLALGRITYAVYQEELKAVEARYALTAEERRAYDAHKRQRKQG